MHCPSEGRDRLSRLRLASLTKLKARGLNRASEAPVPRGIDPMPELISPIARDQVPGCTV